MERAYIDYFFSEFPFAVTIGRLPVSNGPPYEFKNNTTRKATWPRLFVDGEFDGIITTLVFDKWTGLRDAVFRLGYSKIEQNYNQYKGLELDPMRVGFISVESQIPGIKDSLMWLGAQKQFDFVSFEIPGTTFPEDSGSLEQYTLHLQFDNIMNSGLSWFGSASYQDIHPRDQGTVLGPGYEVGLFGDTLHGDLGKEQDSYAVFTGLKYILPIDFLKRPHIGFEYNYGSKYWFPGSINGGEFTNKLIITGHAYEIYYIQPVVDKRMFCRLGAVYQEFDYYNPWVMFGSMDAEHIKSNMSVMNSYFLLDIRF